MRDGRREGGREEGGRGEREGGSALTPFFSLHI